MSQPKALRQQHDCGGGHGESGNGSGKAAGSGNLFDADVYTRNVNGRITLQERRSVGDTRVIVHHLGVQFNILAVGIGVEAKIDLSDFVEGRNLSFCLLDDCVHRERVVEAESNKVVGIHGIPVGVSLVFRLALPACHVGTVVPIFVNPFRVAFKNIDFGVGDNAAIGGIDVVGNAEGSVAQFIDAHDLSGVNNFFVAVTIELGERNWRVERNSCGGRSGHGGNSKGGKRKLHLGSFGGFWYLW